MNKAAMERKDFQKTAENDWTEAKNKKKNCQPPKLNIGRERDNKPRRYY